MKNLILVRHAQAKDAVAHQKDFDRGLSDRGNAQAERQARQLELGKYNIIFHSAALRTTETAVHLHNVHPHVTLQARRDMYNADLNQLIEILEENWELEALVLVGHNPGISHLFYHLTGEWEEFETCTFAQLSFPNNMGKEDMRAAAQIEQIQHPEI